jgi:hypothetical protein
MAVLMDNLLLHVWQRMALERFFPSILMLQFTIMGGVLMFSPQALLTVDGSCRSVLEFPIDFTVAAEFFKKAADSNDADDLNNFGCCLEQGQGVDADIDLAVRYYEKAASLFHIDIVDRGAQKPKEILAWVTREAT